jgi:hypothetical protein
LTSHLSLEDGVDIKMLEINKVAMLELYEPETAKPHILEQLGVLAK